MLPTHMEIEDKEGFFSQGHTITLLDSEDP